MRKFVVMMVLVMMSSSAMAEWIEIMRSTTRTDYVDLSSIRKVGNKAKIWALIDYSTPRLINNSVNLSMAYLVEVDCNEDVSRGLEMLFYPKNMGAGELTNSFDIDNSKWTPNVPGTVGELQFKIACG